MGATQSKDHSEMVDTLVGESHITSKRVERYFRLVDRGDFSIFDSPIEAYQDRPHRSRLPDPESARIHISAPSIYCAVLEVLDIQLGQSFLNVGSGSGYLSCMAGFYLGANGRNHGVEYIKNIYDHSLNVIKKFSEKGGVVEAYSWAPPQIVHGNAFALTGIVDLYDRIYIGAAVEKRSIGLFTSMLREGGVLIVPVLGYTNFDHCSMVRYTRTNDIINDEPFMNVSFAELVPITNDADGQQGSVKKQKYNNEDDPNSRVSDHLLALNDPFTLQRLCSRVIHEQMRMKLRYSHPTTIRELVQRDTSATNAFLTLQIRFDQQRRARRNIPEDMPNLPDEEEEIAIPPDIMNDEEVLEEEESDNNDIGDIEMNSDSSDSDDVNDDEEGLNARSSSSDTSSPSMNMNESSPSIDSSTSNPHLSSSSSSSSSEYFDAPSSPQRRRRRINPSQSNRHHHQVHTTTPIRIDDHNDESIDLTTQSTTASTIADIVDRVSSSTDQLESSSTVTNTIDREVNNPSSDYHIDPINGREMESIDDIPMREDTLTNRPNEDGDIAPSSNDQSNPSTTNDHDDERRRIVDHFGPIVRRYARVRARVGPRYDPPPGIPPPIEGREDDGILRHRIPTVMYYNGPILPPPTTIPHRRTHGLRRERDEEDEIEEEAGVRIAEMLLNREIGQVGGLVTVIGGGDEEIPPAPIRREEEVEGGGGDEGDEDMGVNDEWIQDNGVIRVAQMREDDAIRDNHRVLQRLRGRNNDRRQQMTCNEHEPSNGIRWTKPGYQPLTLQQYAQKRFDRLKGRPTVNKWCHSFSRYLHYRNARVNSIEDEDCDTYLHQLEIMHPPDGHHYVEDFIRETIQMKRAAKRRILIRKARKLGLKQWEEERVGFPMTRRTPTVHVNDLNDDLDDEVNISSSSNSVQEHISYSVQCTTLKIFHQEYIGCIERLPTSSKVMETIYDNVHYG